MISNLIEEMLAWQRKQKVAAESEPRSIRLEPRQIQSVSCVPDDEGGFVANLKKKLFGPPDVIINKLGTFDLDADPDPVKNRIEREIPRPYWADEYVKLYWVTDRASRLRCVRVTFREFAGSLIIHTQAYIRVSLKNGEDLLIYPETRSKYLSLVDQINDMIATDKPTWIKV
jgi:hypothetical protein